MDAYQYFFDTDGNQLGYQQVGEMHFPRRQPQPLARTEGLRAPPAPRREQTARGAVQQAVVLPTGRHRRGRLHPVTADWFPQNTDLGTACGGPSALAVRQSLPVGSKRIQFRAGRAIRVDGLPNGIYYLAVEAEPSGRLIESDTTNNVALRRIRLGGTPTKRWCRCPTGGSHRSRHPAVTG